MGTNYHWRHNICDHCGRYDDWHICRSTTSFRGHFADEWPWNEAKRKFDPPKVLVASWAVWKMLLRHDGEVWDEYGVQRDVEEFIADVEKVKPEQRRRQYDWVRDHPIGLDRPLDQVVPGGTWLDEDGFSFYGGEFS